MNSRILTASICAIMLTVFGCDLGPPQVPPPQEGNPQAALKAPCRAAHGTPDSGRTQMSGDHQAGRSGIHPFQGKETQRMPG